MEKSAYLALGLIATMGCQEGKSDTETETCERVAYMMPYPEPMIEHADRNPLTDVANTVNVMIHNSGGEDCSAADLELNYEGHSSFHELPALASGEDTVFPQKGLVALDASSQDFIVLADEKVIGTESFATRQVGSVLRGQMAGYLADEFGLDAATPCETDLDNGVPAYSSYCEPMRETQAQGWFNEGREYDTLNRAELATVTVRAYPEAFADPEGEAPCPDLSSSEWYYADMQRFAARFPALKDVCIPEVETLIHDLYGTTYPEGGVLDQLAD